jgi:hypothetical protein
LVAGSILFSFNWLSLVDTVNFAWHFPALWDGWRPRRILALCVGCLHLMCRLCYFVSYPHIFVLHPYEETDRPEESLLEHIWPSSVRQ